MNFLKWTIFIIVIFIVFLSFKFFITKNKIVDINNINNSQNYMKIESNVFVNNGKIPILYTCNGGGVLVPIKIYDVPKDAKSLALIVDDPDAPSGDFVHWIVWNINPKTSIIENNNLPNATEGQTSLGRPGWVAPCPPSGVHHYNFKLYALDTILSMPKLSGKKDLISAMEGHIINYTMLTGLYGRE